MERLVYGKISLWKSEIRKMLLKIAIQWNTFFLIILGTILESGFCQVRIDKLSCGSFSRPIHYLFGRADPKLKYLLYTRSNAQDGCDLQPTEKAFRMCNFNPKVKTAVVVHSWIPNLDTCYPVFDLKDKLLQADDYNVVLFNWTAYSNTYGYTSSKPVNYGIAATYSVIVGIKFSSWLHFLQVHGGADANKIHLISHSFKNLILFM
ncbi:pancreatic triacylglycerol lipase-like [Parasteatoda tepidariorum]|uniref:pancreatic triacylglycerol lipase-like n=1 Tax=Parasteatoda tepidariorum TaxID=114398 RepID=UPI0039BD1E24